jgi:hypothetical protein
MLYTIAVVKVHTLSSSCSVCIPETHVVLQESLRLHPPVYGPFLEPLNDEILPLSKPIHTLDGRTISEIPVGKGQIIQVSVAGYNRFVNSHPNDCHLMLNGILDWKKYGVGIPMSLILNVG